MATYYTLSFSENSKGWPSFYTYKPEMMVGIIVHLFLEIIFMVYRERLL